MSKKTQTVSHSAEAANRDESLVLDESKEEAKNLAQEADIDEALESEEQELPESTNVSEEQLGADVNPEPDPDTTSYKKSKSVIAKTHAKSRSRLKSVKMQPQKKWQKIVGLSVGVCALILLVVSGFFSQYYKNKTMPNVYVAGIKRDAKNKQQLQAILKEQQAKFELSFQSGDKTFKPDLKEIELKFDIDKTIERALNAKRRSGLFTKLAFWKKIDVPVESSVNETLLLQYIEKNVPELLKSPQDSQLQFDENQNTFIITPQADGQGVDASSVKEAIYKASANLSAKKIAIKPAVKGPKITKTKLEPLVKPANEMTTKNIVLTGLGYTYKATPSDIASWLTPVPKEDGSIKLVVDSAKVQSYVDAISKRISSAPVDRKILKDPATGSEVVLQQGRDGTELADKTVLSGTITKALNERQDVSQTMNIKTAAYQTVNMDAYEKWIEVDLSEQRTTAYERSNAVKSFTIASGMKGHETVVGEFEIWLKVRKQTMQGGSKADGSYYSIPNVEWVSYFYKDYALHGAWWRKQFGYPASHGCVNMSNSDAQWVYEWAPMGTKVIVHM